MALADLHKELKPHYNEIGRPSIDREVMIRSLLVGYCYGIPSERKLCQEVEVHLAHRWFCKLNLGGKITRSHIARRSRSTWTASARAMCCATSPNA